MHNLHARQFYSIFIRNTIKREDLLTHIVSPDKIEHEPPFALITILNLFDS